MTTPVDPLGSPDAALLSAAASGIPNDVTSALAAGANIEARDPHGRSALLLAVLADDIQTAQLLIEHGADPNAVDDRLDTPWLATGATGSVAMLEILLPAGPDMSIKNRYGGIAVIPASERGHVEYVRRVVRTGIDVNHVNDLGWTALLEAVILGDGSAAYQEIASILLDAGAVRELADRDGVTAAQHAVRLGHRDLAAVLS